MTAVFASVPVALTATVPVAVKVAVPAGSSVTAVAMDPAPEGTAQLDPADAAQVQVTPESAAGKVSVTVAAVAVLGPALLATIVYVTGVPGTAAAWPSVFVTARSPRGVSVSVSVAVLLADTGSVTPPGVVTVAVLASVPSAPGATVPVAVKVTVPPASRFTVRLMLPAPEAAMQLEPAEAAQVQVTPVMAAGNVSATVAPFTAIVALVLVATIVYVTAWPGIALTCPSVLVTVRSATAWSSTVKDRL